jgi:hypothetical protein
MRAIEFIVEQVGKPSKRIQQATRGLNLFRDKRKTNSDYTLNRVMMAVACADGTATPVDIEDMSWIGTRRSAHPYTKEEQEMLKQAYKAAGAEWEDLNNGDMDSKELESTNKQSPINGFAGYPR